MKGDHSMLRSRGISVPINAILLTVAIIAITSAVAVGSMAYVSAAGGRLREASSSPVLLLHEAIETVYLSNPGTSTTVLVKSERGPITSAPAGNGTAVSFPFYLPVTALGYTLPDPAGIVSSISSTSDNSTVTYSIRMNQFTIPAGVCGVTVSKDVDGSLELEAIAG
jgi:type II secretory pathway pseudopilin PulG